MLEAIDEIEPITGRRLRFKIQPPRPGDQRLYVTDFSKLNRQVGWKPRLSVKQTLELIYHWWRENRSLFTLAASLERMPLAGFAEVQGALP